MAQIGFFENGAVVFHYGPSGDRKFEVLREAGCFDKIDDTGFGEDFKRALRGDPYAKVAPPSQS